MKTMVITGASRGIGKYLADYYAKKDYFVVPVSKTNGFDVTSFSDCQVACSMCERIDVLINCAGIATMSLAALSDPKRCMDIINTNILGTHNMCALAFAYLRKTKGRVINFSSIAAQDNIPGEAIYGASKAGIESLTKTLAKEFGHFEVTVNCIAPNPIDTDLIAGVPKSKILNIIRRQAIQEYGTFQDIANVCDFFISPESRMITGQVLRIGGP